jgi:hypothetical protein
MHTTTSSWSAEWTTGEPFRGAPPRPAPKTLWRTEFERIFRMGAAARDRAGGVRAEPADAPSGSDRGASP